MPAVFVQARGEEIGILRSSQEVPRGRLIEVVMVIIVRKSRHDDVLRALWKFKIKTQSSPLTHKRVKITFKASREEQEEIQMLLDGLSLAISTWIEGSDDLCSQIAPEYRF